MKRSKIINKIYSYAEDSIYLQTLETIFINLPESDWKRFYDMIIEADNKNAKIVISEDTLPDMWDSLRISNIKIK